MNLKTRKISEVLLEKKSEVYSTLTSQEKEERDEKFRKSFLIGDSEDKGIFEYISGRPMTMSEYLEYWERFYEFKKYGEVYNIKDFIIDTCCVEVVSK